MIGTIEDCVTSCDIDLRSMLRSSLILSGGTTSLPNFEKLLDRSLEDAQLRIIKRDMDRVLGSCLGSAILAKLDLNDSRANICKFITRQDYDEIGCERLLNI